MNPPWRYLDTGKDNAFVNMAIDEAILENYLRKGGPPTLRFYEWHPPALSLGMGQSIDEINAQQCQSLGIDMVRRPTGGRAVLHHEELTYSIVASGKEGFPNSISGIYHMIAQVFIHAYDKLGVPVEMKRKKRTPGINRICFLTSTLADLLSNGKKIIGNAQVRRGNAFLQHGSLVIDHDIDLMLSLFNYPSEDDRKKARRSFNRTTTSLNKVLLRKIDYEEIKQAIRRSFKELWGVDLYQGELTKEEISLKNSLIDGKYSH